MWNSPASVFFWDCRWVFLCCQSYESNSQWKKDVIGCFFLYLCATCVWHMSMCIAYPYFCMWETCSCIYVCKYIHVETQSWSQVCSFITHHFVIWRKLSYWAQSFIVLARVANQFVLGIFSVFILSSEIANGHQSWPMATKLAQLLFGFCGSKVWSSWSAPSTEQSPQTCDSLPP